MFDNLLPLAVVIIVLWVGVLAYYMTTSRQQGKLQDSLKNLRELLDEADHQDS